MRSAACESLLASEPGIRQKMQARHLAAAEGCGALAEAWGGSGIARRESPGNFVRHDSVKDPAQGLVNGRSGNGGGSGTVGERGLGEISGGAADARNGWWHAGRRVRRKGGEDSAGSR
jgi:hypothetical protein